jgi:RNA polymerase-interacting CarD/CdnL/TRCF family regulator
MLFEIKDQVVQPGFGIGRVAKRVMMAFGEAPQQEYYEITSARSTVWVPLAPGAEPALRALTRKDELGHYRGVLAGQPGALNPDFRQRHLEMRSKARQGTLLAVCEVVRDLNARSWLKPLSEGDSNLLRHTRETLCEEWAAADDVSLPDASAEVSALLKQGQRTYQI